MALDESANKNQYKLLETIHSPDDLKAIPVDQLAPLAEEIRTFLIQHVQKSGGHLASNLGVVELTIALHRVFSSPKDHIIFDVGHQCYIHKLLTGRMEAFEDLRTGGGISGFPKREESEHDPFGTGHSSTSLSASLGFAEFDHINHSDAYTVCVVGDGAFTGGMIHEALNNCKKDLRLIIVMNENEMSISKNIGSFAKALSRLRSSRGYFRTKKLTATILRKIPFIGKFLFQFVLKCKVNLKELLYGSNYFENLGLYYLGPVDGNNEGAVEQLLEEAKKTGQSCVVHLKTQKGKGFEPAEKEPGAFHGIPPADKQLVGKPNFSNVMGNHLVALAKDDARICAITAAMSSGTGLTAFREHYPDRFFDVGIAEAHAATFAAGLAANGARPVFAVYSSFLQRSYDSLVHDVCLQNLPVVFCIDRAGFNPSDGATHHGIFDVAYLSSIPNMHIYTPITESSLQAALSEALSAGHPCAIRYPNACEEACIKEAFYKEETNGFAGVRSDFSLDTETPEAIIITHGRIVMEALRAKDMLQRKGKTVGILLLEKIKPYDETAKILQNYLPAYPCKLLFLEEEIRAGGMGMMLSDALRNYDVIKNKTILLMGTDDTFAIQNKKEPILKTVGLNAENILRYLLQ